MSLHEVGVFAYSQGFALSRDDDLFREIGFCDWTGHHHVLFKYTLPPGMAYALLLGDAKTLVDRQTRTVHDLPFEPFLSEHNQHEFHPYHQLKDDVTRWRVGVLNVNGLYRFFQHPWFCQSIVALDGRGCRELSTLPIATVNVMATNDHGQNWYHDHIHGEHDSDIWHDCCARLSNEWMDTSTFSRVTDCVSSQRPTGALAETLRSKCSYKQFKVLWK